MVAAAAAADGRRLAAGWAARTVWGSGPSASYGARRGARSGAGGGGAGSWRRPGGGAGESLSKTETMSEDGKRRDKLKQIGHH